MKGNKAYVHPEISEENVNYRDVLTASNNPSAQDVSWDEDVLGGGY